jgi:minichromosome maintenance protein 10
MSTAAGLEDLDEDDEDEETLQLQLQEIQARLKLKKLQKSKAKDPRPSDERKNSIGGQGAVLARANSAAAGRLRPDGGGSQREALESAKPQASIHVPVSPTRRVQTTEPARSPGRVLLGIDKGLKGGDVSLRRAPSLRHVRPEAAIEERRTVGYLQRANSQTSNHGSGISRSQSSLDDNKPRTFSERMAAVRTQEAESRERDARIQRARSKAFDIDAQQMEEFKSAATAMPEVTPQAPDFSRNQIISAYNKPAGGLLQRSKSTSAISSGTMTESASRITSTNSSAVSASQASSQSRRKLPAKKEESVPSEFEIFSSLHLSKRIIPHTILTRTLAGKKTLILPELLKVVVAPQFRLPDVEEDIVVLAVIASKSEPKKHKAKSTNEERGKYMVMTLTDLKWELDMFLFNSGFDKFWKLTPGTVIAILNPSIMPPMKADTGRFSITLNSSDDTVLELGTARDLGFCKSVKTDGKTCDAWIDKRHTEYCDFHVNAQLKKTTAGRMEVNSMNFGKKRNQGSDTYGARKFNSRYVTPREEPPKDGSKYDWESKSKYYIAAPARGPANFIGGPGRSTANLLDDPDVDPDAFHRGSSKEERMRRQLAAAEKERETARKLGAVGGGLGADYMRKRDRPTLDSSSINDDPAEPAPDVAILGLLGSKTKAVQLSPIKRKRAGTSTPTSSDGAMGWGGHLTKELGRMKDGERLQPLKKKTRFVTAKGIREAGRESFGGDVAAPTSVDDDDDDDDDDDLDIIK